MNYCRLQQRPASLTANRMLPAGVVCRKKLVAILVALIKMLLFVECVVSDVI